MSDSPLHLVIDICPVEMKRRSTGANDDIIGKFLIVKLKQTVAFCKRCFAEDTTYTTKSIWNKMYFKYWNFCCIVMSFMNAHEVTHRILTVASYHLCRKYCYTWMYIKIFNWKYKDFWTFWTMLQSLQWLWECSLFWKYKQATLLYFVFQIHLLKCIVGGSISNTYFTSILYLYFKMYFTQQ